MGMDVNFLLPHSPEEGGGGRGLGCWARRGRGLEGGAKGGLKELSQRGGRPGWGKRPPPPRGAPLARARAGSALKLVCKPAAV